MLMLWSPSHRPSANKNNDNFDKVIKVKKINNIKRNVRRFFFSYSARKGDFDDDEMDPQIESQIGMDSEWDLRLFFSTDGPNSLSDWILFRKRKFIPQPILGKQKTTFVRPFIPYNPKVYFMPRPDYVGDKRKSRWAAYTYVFILESTQLKSSTIIPHWFYYVLQRSRRTIKKTKKKPLTHFKGFPCVWRPSSAMRRGESWQSKWYLCILQIRIPKFTVLLSSRRVKSLTLFEPTEITPKFLITVSAGGSCWREVTDRSAQLFPTSGLLYIGSLVSE